MDFVLYKAGAEYGFSVGMNGTGLVQYIPLFERAGK
jgi:hypothetical protein